MFNTKEATEKLITGIQKWFEENGKGCNACIGMSGGKDSLISCALCVKALGADRVIGVGIPDKGQSLNEADEMAEYFGIRFHVVNISGVTAMLKTVVLSDDIDLTKQAEQNIPPRMRMVVLYAVSQSNNGRVIGTCNASENYVGYFTKYGDGASDFEPIAELTVNELYQVGEELGLPKKWLYKTPSADLPHTKTDEDELGFTYKNLDDYIRTGTSGDERIDAMIAKRHAQNLFKLRPVETIKIDTEDKTLSLYNYD